MLKICRPSVDQLNLYYEMYLDFVNNHERDAKYRSIDLVKERIRNEMEWEQGINVPDDSLPQLSFWFLDEEGSIVGTSRLRPKLNDRFFHSGGSIGYDVRPSCRKKGYGTEILRLTLEKAKESNLDKVLVTCDDDNIPSWKIIEANKGVLENREYDEIKGKLMRRYWINL